MQAIRGIDGLLGIFVHGLVTVVVVYLAISALVVLDNAFKPAVANANLTLTQVNQLENEILSNPITSAMVSKSDLQALKDAAAKGSANINNVGGIHQLEQIYSSFLQPQLHSSHLVPIILNFGKHLPFIGHIGPDDLKALPSPSPTACPTPTPKTTPTAKVTPKPTATPKTTASPAACPTPSPTK
jgi:hypothetical protein